MSEELTIDQVIVRKAGGYNLRSVAWWTDQTPNERHSLIAKGDVQFFASGVEVDPSDAAAQLEIGSAPEIARDEPPVAPTGPVVVQAFASAPTGARYTRRVVEGPRWLVTRSDDEGETELHVLHGHADDSAYDLATAGGANQLSNDLLADALGAPATFVAEHPEAFTHFKETIFDLHLGNRPWEVLASKIQGSMASNPHLRIASSAPTG